MSNDAKVTFRIFPVGISQVQLQSMFFGWWFGYPGLVSVLFTTEPHSAKSIVITSRINSGAPRAREARAWAEPHS